MNCYAVYDQSGRILYKFASHDKFHGNGMVELTIPEYNALDVEKEQTIFDLKNNLKETDYIVIKIAEGSATVEEYAETIAKRKEWRKMINDIGG